MIHDWPNVKLCELCTAMVMLLIRVLYGRWDVDCIAVASYIYIYMCVYVCMCVFCLANSNRALVGWRGVARPSSSLIAFEAERAALVFCLEWTGQ